MKPVMITYRAMTEEELPKLADIDRSETIREAFAVESGELTAIAVEWDDPGWSRAGDGEHTVVHQIDFCRRHLGAGAAMVGAFEADRLAGAGLLTPEIRPGMAQLAFLYVGAPYRRRGVGTALVRRLFGLARALGAERVYVSATPSRATVEFYARVGFALAADPLPELYAFEPEDIHMVALLAGSSGAFGSRLEGGAE